MWQCLAAASNISDHNHELCMEKRCFFLLSVARELAIGCELAGSMRKPCIATVGCGFSTQDRPNLICNYLDLIGETIKKTTEYDRKAEQ